MDKIIEPNVHFDFSGLTLVHPITVPGGGYFTKFEYVGKPLYIQTPKSLTKQGIIKTGKKYHCDLMFDKSAESLIQWFENLEETCYHLIYEKKDDWFDGKLSITDIESAFNSVIRIYKSGKNYLLRANIKNSKDDQPMVKIYSETQSSLSVHDIGVADTEIISILDIQGIKFTPRSFQIEIELKQVMIIDNEPIFETCIIKRPSKPMVSEKESKTRETELREKESNLEPTQRETELKETENKSRENESREKETELKEIELKEKELGEIESKELEPVIENEEPVANVESEITIQFDELPTTNGDELTEIQDLPIENTSMVLKKPSQVYFELYKEARNKAKQAKKNAILAYLEAKNIKKTYLLENIDDDSDFDAEIEETSESELDGL